MDSRIGIWAIGACGSVSTCMVAGIEAMRAGVTARTGLVTELEEFRSLPLARPENLVFGGHDTSRAMLAVGVALLCSHPNELARLLRDPSLAQRAGDEVLRCEPLVQVMSRECPDDLEVAGVRLPAGEPFMLAIIAAKPLEHPWPDDIELLDPKFALPDSRIVWQLGRAAAAQGRQSLMAKPVRTSARSTSSKSTSPEASRSSTAR